MQEFLINPRSLSILNLIDAFSLTESELQDVWDGVFNRISELRVDLHNRVVGFDDPMIYVCPRCQGIGEIETFEDHVENYECPNCNGNGVLHDEIVEDEEVEELVDDDIPY